MRGRAYGLLSMIPSYREFWDRVPLAMPVLFHFFLREFKSTGIARGTREGGFGRMPHTPGRRKLSPSQAQLTLPGKATPIRLLRRWRPFQTGASCPSYQTNAHASTIYNAITSTTLMPLPPSQHPPAWHSRYPACLPQQTSYPSQPRDQSDVCQSQDASDPVAAGRAT